jgi:hypothetical protein
MSAGIERGVSYPNAEVRGQLRPAPFRRIVRTGDREAQALSWRDE